MIKEAINYFSQPAWSFSAFIVLFYFAMKRMDIVGTKKFGIGLLIGTLGIFIWMITDPVFSLLSLFLITFR